LRDVFESIEDPCWDGGAPKHPLLAGSKRFPRMKKIAHPGEKIV
jgi:putative proteasome-type protease